MLTKSEKTLRKQYLPGSLCKKRFSYDDFSCKDNLDQLLGVVRHHRLIGDLTEGDFQLAGANSYADLRFAKFRAQATKV